MQKFKVFFYGVVLMSAIILAGCAKKQGFEQENPLKRQSINETSAPAGGLLLEEGSESKRSADSEEKKASDVKSKLDKLKQEKSINSLNINESDFDIDDSDIDDKDIEEEKVDEEDVDDSDIDSL